MSRERILEDALKHELRAVDSTAGQNCVDAEMLAAWQDDGLDAKAVAAIESHVSTCARCQALVAVSLRPEALGTTAPTLGTEAPRHPGTFAFWKWLAPLGAAAAAVTLWMVVPEQREIAVAPPQPPAAKADTVVAEQPRAAEPPPPAPPAVPQARDSNRPAIRQNVPSEERAASMRQDAAAPKELEARKEAVADMVTAASPAPPPPAPSPSAPARAAQSTADQPAIAGLQRNQFALTPFEIISSDSSQRWRVTASGVERSLDLGGTWSLVRAAGGDTITAGVSPLPNVCWLIGNNGVVLLTTDGAVFTRSVIADAGNLRSISASDARSASVVTVAGRTFRTDDGGRSWR
jgi:hypothetical protein